MKIALIAGRDPTIINDTDGGSVFIEYLIKHFSKINSNLDIFIPSGIIGGSFSKKRMNAQKKNKQINNFVQLIYFPVKPQTKKEGNYFDQKIEKAMSFVDFFKDKKLFKYDLILILHVANSYPLVKFELTPLNKTIIFPMMTSENYKLFSKVPISYIKKEKEVFDKVLHICSPSNDEINKIIKKFNTPKKKLFKVNRGFEEKDFPAIKRNSVKNTKLIKLICANGIRPQKDHLFLIKVARELKKQNIKFIINLTGNDGKSYNDKYNQYTQKFWNEVKKFSLEKNFKSHHILSRNKIVNLLKKSDIALYPSISETFGKSALESVVSGLPTIVPKDVSAYKEFIKNNINGFIVERDEKKWVKLIIKLINDDKLYEKISTNGIAIRRKFTWEKVTTDLLYNAFKRKIINISFNKKSLNSILSKLKDKSRIGQSLVRRSWKFANEVHSGQYRKSGESFTIHPENVALNLASIGADAETVAAGLLHDTVEDTSVTKEMIEKKFGKNVAFLIDGVTKLGDIKYKGEKNKVETWKKFFLASAKDKRVVIIKLFDRLHNMQTNKFHTKERRVRKAEETLKMYAPIAARLGVNYLDYLLEEYSFPYVYKTKYKEIRKLRNDYIKKRLKEFNKAKQILNKELKNTSNINWKIINRKKGLYRLWKKIERVGDIYNVKDIYVLRIITQNIQDCYNILEIVNKTFKPLDNEYKDYISIPKLNGYRSLHTVVSLQKEIFLEIQIRTYGMEEEAKYGIFLNKKENTIPWMKDLAKVKNKLPIIKRDS